MYLFLNVRIQDLVPTQEPVFGSPVAPDSHLLLYPCSLKPIFWLPNANEIDTNNLKWGLAYGVTQILGLASGVTQILALGNAKIYQHVGIFCVR